MSVPKNSKTYHFQNEGEIEYFLVTVKDKCCCLICNASVSLPQKGSLERLYNALHNNKRIRRVVEYLSFQFKSDLNIKESAATICENYSLSKPSLENEILTLKMISFSRLMLDKNRFRS
jgi:hypothetical protein